MKLERIGYLFHPAELNAMLALTGSGSVPFRDPPTSQEVEQGIDSLQRSFLAERSGDVVILDRVSAFLASSIGRCLGCVCISSGERYYGIVLSNQLCLLIVLKNNLWLLTPFQTLSEALAAFAQDFPKLRNPVYLGTKYRQETQFILYESETAFRKAMEAAQTLCLCQLDEMEEVKDDTWKP